MSDAASQQSPLLKVLAANRQPEHTMDRGVRLAEREYGYLNVRAASTPSFVERIELLSGIRLPVKPNRVTEAKQGIALWLGPNEWLLVVPLGTEGTLAQSLREAGRDHFFVVTDISHGYTTINASGPCVLDTLSKGCSLDLHPAFFKKNDCAQTLLAKTGTVIRCVDETPCFDLIVRRSFAEYLALWLRDAGSEYGVEVR